MRTTADVLANLMDIVCEIAIEQGGRELSGTDWAGSTVRRIEKLRKELKYVPQLTNEVPYYKRQKIKSILAKNLRKQGCSIRDIMRRMGYKSTSSVQRLLKI